MKRFFSIWMLVMVATATWAQYSVSGKVASQKDGSAIEVATVRLFTMHGQDSTLVQGAQTGLDGGFTLTGISSGSYQLWLSNVGYKPKKVAVHVRGKDLAVGTIKLEEDIQTLSEVRVQGHAAEMTVKGDTIEYNTQAYKMGENAMVEDLLKKAIQNGVKYAETGPQLEMNQNVLSQWRLFDTEQHKRRRCFIRMLDGSEPPVVTRLDDLNELKAREQAQAGE